MEINTLRAKLDLMPKKLFGEMVRTRRMALNLSQRDLAKRINRSATYINYVERGINPSAKDHSFKPSVEAVDAIAKVLRIDENEARLAAGYAPRNPETRPTNATELVAALEKLGIDFQGNFDGVDLAPDEYQRLLESVRLAVELTLHRSERSGKSKQHYS
jgi:transcriptional regulator with XRE-family HTH domain